MKLLFSTKFDHQIHSKARFRDNFRLMMLSEFPFIKAILVNTFAMSLLGLAIPLTVQSVINTITSRTMLQPLAMLCLILFFILSFTSVLQIIQTYTVEVLKRRLFVKYGLIISERLTHYQDENFKKQNSAGLINRYFDILIMQSSMVSFFVDGFGFLIMFTIGFGLLVFYHPYFLIFAVAMAAFLILNWMLFGPDGVRAGSPEADGKHEVVSWVEELSRVRNIFSSEQGRSYSNTKMLDLFNAWLEKRNTLFNFQFRQHIGLQLFNVITNVLLLLIGGYLVLGQELSLGQLVAAALVVINITSSLPRLQNFFFSVYDFSTAIDKVAQFYDYPLEEKSNVSATADSQNIELKNIFIEPNYNFSFVHPNKKNNYILVKSYSSLQHLYDLIMGFKKPSKGSIYYGDKISDDIDFGVFRNKVQLIRHDQFFSGTVLENLVGLSNSPISMTEVHDAVEKVGLLENILDLELKFNTLIRSNGYPFSKSQLLALQFARALLTKPSLLYITPDFEQISKAKKKKVFHEIMNPNHNWIVMFFSQKQYSAKFESYYSLDRDGLHPIKSEEDLKTQLVQHV